MNGGYPRRRQPANPKPKDWKLVPGARAREYPGPHERELTGRKHQPGVSQSQHRSVLSNLNLVGGSFKKHTRNSTHLQEQPMTDWQGIATAPKDGQKIRVRRENKEAIVQWSRALNDWSLGRAQNVERPGVQELLTWEPIEWAPFGETGDDVG